MSALTVCWKRILPLCLAILMMAGCCVTAFAAPVANAHTDAHVHDALSSRVESALQSPVILPTVGGGVQAPRSIFISTALTVGKNAFLGYKLLRGAVAGGESWKRGGSITDVAADAISGFTGLRISNVDVREMYAEIQKQFEDVHSQLGDLTKTINEMSAAIDDLRSDLQKFSAEIVINDFKQQYVNAYTAINREYLDLHAALQNPKADQKAAYDELYVAALQFHGVVYPYLSGTTIAGEDSILDVMYRYATHTESPDSAVSSANAIAQEIYGAYVFAEYCLMTCELYQANACVENDWAEYAYATGKTTPRERYGALLEEARVRQTAMNHLLASFIAELNLDNSYLYNPSASDLYINYPASVMKASTGDRLYFYAMPELFEGIFNPEGFSFRVSDPSLASVTHAGVVDVTGESGSFTVSLFYRAEEGAAEIELYRLTINITRREFSGGFGTEEAPFVISTPQDFQNIIEDYPWFRDNNYVFALYNDINMGGIDLEPLDLYEFNGTLDGNGFAVYNFRLEQAFFDDANTGLFCVNNGTIRNLQIGKAGFTNSGYGKSVHIGFDCDRATWQIENSNLGAFCGTNNGMITNCVVENVLIEQHLSESDDNTSNYSNVGAIAGWNTGTISNCLVRSSSIAASMSAYDKSGDDNGARAGGLVGVMSGGKLSQSLVIGSTLSAEAHASGSSTLGIKNKANAYAWVGGLVAKQSGGEVSYCFAYSNTTTVSAVNDNKYFDQLVEESGGLAGEATGGSGTKNLAAATSDTMIGGTANGMGGTWVRTTGQFAQNYSSNSGVILGSDSVPMMNDLSSITLDYSAVKTQYRKNESFNPVGILVTSVDARGTQSGSVPFFRVDASGFGSSGGTVFVSSYGGLSQSFTATRTCDHVWGEGNVTKQPTHTATGTKVYTCSECGGSKTETLATVAHTFDRKVLTATYLVSEATCLSPAVYYFSCSCGAAGGQTFLDEASGLGAHDLLHYPAEAADCTKDVTAEHYVCRTCERIFRDAEATDEVSDPADLIVSGTGHTYLSRDVAPTCTENGYTLHICNKCGHQYQDNYQLANGHDEVIDAAVAATCTESGLTAGKHCATCSAVLTPQTVIPANGHTIVIEPGKRVTCTENGLTEGRYCSVCHEVFAVQTEIIAKGHVQVIDPMRAPTCTATGLTEGSHCSACGYVYVAQNEIAAKGHTEVNDAAVEPTCTQNGRTAGKHCTECHTVTVQPQTIPALGHTEAIDAAVPATCTESGLSQGKHCTVCFAVTLAQNTVPALGHVELISSAVAPTCLQSGLTEGRRCNVCGVTTLQQTSIPALGHTEVIDAAIPATCTENGLTEGKHCRDCSQIFVAQSVVPATGHGALSDWETVTPPSAGVEGMRQKTCTACGEVMETEVIEALPIEGNTEPESDNDSGETGCGAQINGSASILLILMLIGAAVVQRRKENA